MDVWYPNRTDWRMIETLVVTVVIAWALTSRAENQTTRLFVGLVIFSLMLWSRHFRR
jgi:hypothetical protein